MFLLHHETDTISLNLTLLFFCFVLFFIFIFPLTNTELSTTEEKQLFFLKTSLNVWCTLVQCQILGITYKPYITKCTFDPHLV